MMARRYNGGLVGRRGIIGGGMKGGTLSFLGTGTSVGVPMLGCDCAVCRSADPRNHRYRCSVLFRLLVAVALRWGLNPNDLKLITALFVFSALVLPRLLARRRGGAPAA